MEEWVEKYCHPELIRVLQRFEEIAGADELYVDHPCLLYFCLLEADPSLQPEGEPLPLELVREFAETLSKSPRGSGHWYFSGEEGVLIKPADVLDEIVDCFEVVLLYWWLGRFPSALITRPRGLSRGKLWWSRPGEMAASSLNQSEIRPLHLLLDALQDPSLLADYAPQRRQISGWLRGDGQPGWNAQSKAVMRYFVNLCVLHNLFPNRINLALAVLSIPDLDDPLLDHMQAELQPAFEKMALGRLPYQPLVLEGPLQLVCDGQVLLHPESSFAQAEELLGRGRVGRWIPRKQGWLRVEFDQSLLSKIELRPPTE